MTIYFYDYNDYDSIGVQSIYKAGGKTNVSNIVYVGNPTIGIGNARGIVIIRKADGTITKEIK